MKRLIILIIQALAYVPMLVFFTYMGEIQNPPSNFWLLLLFVVVIPMFLLLYLSYKLEKILYKDDTD